MPQNKKKNLLNLIILLLLLALVAMLSLLLGAQKLSLRDIFGKGTSKYAPVIFYKIRCPRTILSLVAGILLAGSGAAFQLYFRNSLAEPGIMGISSGATLGAVIAASISSARILNGTLSLVSFGAFAGALISGTLIITLSAKKAGPQATTALLLSGTALGTLYSAFSSLILTVKQNELKTMYVWMMGSFNGRGWSEVRFIAVPALLAILLLLFCSRDLDLLNTGELTASSLGLNIKKTRTLVLISGSLACSAAVCAGGTIGFAGLIAPHIARRLFGSSSKTLIPTSMLTGAILLTASDTLCRTVIAPNEIPIGIILTLIGAPFFISLIFSKQGLKNG